MVYMGHIGTKERFGELCMKLYPTYSGGYTCVKSTAYTKNQSPFYSVHLESIVLRS